MRFGIPLEMLDTNLQYLDSSHTDLELKEIWNGIYDKWGCRILQLEERWCRDNGIKDFGEEDESSEPMGERIEEFFNNRRSKYELIELG
jgi:hypothetical protein